MKKIKLSAFTLVELVITIAITTIIASISYIAFQDYFTTSKDSMRIEDMKSLNASMNSIKLQNGGYSYPGNYFAIINSWTSSEQVYQGFIDSNVALNNMLQIPKDPKTSNYYVLSTTKTKQQYQIAMTLDNNGDNKAYVDWDYYSNSITLFPSIILAYSWTTAQEIWSWIVTNWSTGSINRSKFILNWSKLNMPYSFSTKNVVWTATSYNQIIEESWVKIDRNIDYYTCEDLYDDKKFLWPWNYDLLDTTSWSYISVYCSWVTITVTNWICWSSSGQILSSPPSTNLCSAWASSSILYDTWIWQYTRTCSTTSCKAYDNYTVLLLHFDGNSNNYWTNTWTIVNNWVTYATWKFLQSAYFNWSSSYLSIPDSDDWDFPWDMTIDFFINFNSISNNPIIFWQSANNVAEGSDQYAYFDTSHNEIRWASLPWEWCTGIPLNIWQWYHLAFVKRGSNLYYFVDGILKWSTTTSWINTWIVANLLIWYWYNIWYLSGYIDEFRISKWIARRTAWPFAIPNKPY